MIYTIVHEMPGRIRLRCGKWIFTKDEALAVAQLLRDIPGVVEATVRPANGSILVCYDEGDAANTPTDTPTDVPADDPTDVPTDTPVRNAVLSALDALSACDLPQKAAETTPDMAELDNRFQMKLAATIGRRIAWKLLVPMPVRNVTAALHAVAYVWKGLRFLFTRGLTVEVLDAAAIGASVLQRSFSTASSVMFLLHLSDLLAEYTQARARCALRENLAVYADAVWLVQGDTELEVALADVQEGDIIRVRTGAMIPIDGTVVEGEAEVNEASMTGEAALVAKTVGSSVFAGTVVDEGSILVQTRAVAGQSRIDEIVRLVEDSEDLKANMQGKAERLADALVPYSFAAFLIELAATRNITRATSVLMVDYSCAIKLSTPIAIMSAMREAAKAGIVVKGGRFLEELAAADTIIFDKTGTLTSACPTVEKIISFNGDPEHELLHMAACLEEHFPHSMARAIVRSAHDAGIVHGEEDHTEVEYVVAHGISSSVRGKRVRIGSAHFIFEDEGVPAPENLKERILAEAPGASSVYMAIGDELAAAFCISDPLRPEAPRMIDALRQRGFTHIAMLTGDSENCARVVANELGLDEYHSQVLPEDKASYVDAMKAQGRRVVMVGDGVNDSPALAAADVSVAMSDASDIARMVADVTLTDCSLESLLLARDLATLLMKRVSRAYGFIASFNTALIALGMVGALQPSVSATLHNASTAAITALNMRCLVPPALTRQAE